MSSVIKKIFFIHLFLSVSFSNMILYSQNLWEPVGNLDGKVIDKLIFDYSGKFYALISDTGYYSNEIYYSTDDGNTWSLFTDNFQDYYIQDITFNKYNKPYVLANVGEVKMFYSTDEGSNWMQVDTNFVFTQTSRLVTNNDYNLYTNGEFSIYSSTDNGITWLQKNRPSISGQINWIRIDSTGNLYSQISTYESDYVYRSPDSGVSWYYIPLSFVQAFGCNTLGLLLCSTISHSGGIYYNLSKSTDHGISWNHVVNNVLFLSLMVTKEGKVYGYNDFSHSFQFSSDTGKAWINYNSGLPSGRITSVAIDSYGYLFAATPDGLYRTIDQITSLKQEDSRQPKKYLLIQNYPNPFNPSTTIKYDIPEMNFITIKIYDILGRDVAILVNEEKLSGNYEVEFNGKNLTSGIYFYQLSAGNYTEAKKMILLK
jgi:hypothetical protein